LLAESGYLHLNHSVIKRTSNYFIWCEIDLDHLLCGANLYLYPGQRKWLDNREWPTRNASLGASSYQNCGVGQVFAFWLIVVCFESVLGGKERASLPCASRSAAPVLECSPLFAEAIDARSTWGTLGLWDSFACVHSTR